MLLFMSKEYDTLKITVIEDPGPKKFKIWWDIQGPGRFKNRAYRRVFAETSLMHPFLIVLVSRNSKSS